MKRPLFSLMFFLSMLPGLSQSSFDRYSSRITIDGTCYFFKDYKLTCVDGIKRFQYDMTYPDWTDSITVNFSLYCDMPVVPRQFSLRGGDKEYVCNDFHNLYVDIIKGGYEIRMTSKFAKDDIVALLQQPESPMAFEMETKGRKIFATYKKGAWKKDRKRLNDIFTLIKIIK